MSLDIVRTADCVVIGGGIVGTSCAFYIAREGIKSVVILERGIIGEGSTGRCVGGIRAQFSTEINIMFSLASMKVFENFEDELGIDPEFHRCGYLLLASTQEKLDALKAGLFIQRRLGLDVELLSQDEIAMRWPFLKVEDILGGTFCKREGFAGPHEVLQGFLKGCRRHGVKIYQHTEAIGIGIEKGKVLYVETEKGRIYTRCVINAGGPYANQVGMMAGLDIPVVPVRRQVFVTAPLEGIKGEVPLIIDIQRGWYFRREGKGFLISGPVDTKPSVNIQCDYESMAEAARMAIRRVPIFKKTGIVRGWAGLYEITPDRHAILGPVDGIQGLILANGFSGHGFMHSPITGRLIAELIVHGRTLSIDISPLSLTRFSTGNLIHEPLTAFR